MATIINISNGSIPQLLASLTNVPTSSRAISGTENWKKYDAIYFVCTIHYTDTSGKAVFTNLILTKYVSIGDNYQFVRVSGSSGETKEINGYCLFSENALSIYKKELNGYGITKLNIYGVNF